MFHKTLNINGCKTTKSVILMMARHEEGSVVEITAWHTIEEGYHFQQDVVHFEDEEIAMMYITDFSPASANVWANSCIF